jgi:predicted alpha/beta hydrolase family esterase
MQFVIVPGIDNSDEQHWQSIWEAEWGPAATRIAVGSWTAPDLDDWVGAIERAVRMAGTPDVVLVAHSGGCWAAASWVANRESDARGVFLVAPPDHHGDLFRSAASSFTAVVPEPLELPGLMVSSDTDPYCAPQVAEQLAADWGVPRIGVGRLGHINSSSGIGRWDFGRALLTAFTAGLRDPSTESRREV